MFVVAYESAQNFRGCRDGAFICLTVLGPLEKGILVIPLLLTVERAAASRPLGLLLQLTDVSGSIVPFENMRYKKDGLSFEREEKSLGVNARHRLTFTK